MGLHRGNAQIQHDERKFATRKDVPCKPSIGRVKAHKLLCQPQAKTTFKLTMHGQRYHSDYVSKIEYQQWKKLYRAVKYQDPLTRNAKANV